MIVAIDQHAVTGKIRGRLGVRIGRPALALRHEPVNTSNAAMWALLRRHPPKALEVLSRGEPRVEITGPA